MDAVQNAAQSVVHAKKRDIFVVQHAMVDCITVAQTLKNSCPCSIIRWYMSGGWLINGSILWIGSSSRVCVGGYVVVGGWFGQAAGMIVS